MRRFRDLLLLDRPRIADEDLHQSPGASPPVRAGRHVGDTKLGKRYFEPRGGLAESHSAQPFRFSDRAARLSIEGILTQNRKSTGPRPKVALGPLALYDVPARKLRRGEV